MSRTVVFIVRGARMGMAHYLRIDTIHVGGITETKKIAIMGEVHDIDIALHNPGSPICAAACIHVAFSSPNFGIQETAPQSLSMREVFPVQPEVRNGHFEPPTLPGLGLEFDEAAALRWQGSPMSELPHLRNADGSVTDW